MQHNQSTILENTDWIEECVNIYISTNKKAEKQFVEDMEWFIENHNEFYIDKKGEKTHGYYWGKDRSNVETLKRFSTYIENKRNPRNKRNLEWLADIYKSIPVDEILSYMQDKYGNR